ncbi:hypothetical protein CS0771_33850 [Catellatospora sp. IY07-71]|uniref:hypothetical protein n=1 Tax=Catellatospora sp. IY07-71 TaxID=2728827 RepID=UPI001BB325DA|nr:hypothetical protein [Catellatospora sp. IY07-71]BCJ73841.1 hypothetical protein CS0771_33850 [Catellatospora sp. IY07-71]
MLLFVIAACEIGFWVILGAGLAARYLLRWQTVSTVLLVAVPVTDLVLLAATAIDLHRGATATFAHGLAAAYLGFSVAFGHSMVRWADVRFAHRFAGGPAPVPPPRYGAARTRHEWREWGKAFVAWLIAVVLLATAIWYVGDAARTAELAGWIWRLSSVLVIWLLGWPVWYTLFPRREPSRA